MYRRVAITGIGIINPLGIDKNDFFNSLISGKSGIKKITRFNTEGFPVQAAGEITEFPIDDFISKRLKVKTDRFTHYALASAELALQDSKLRLEEANLNRVGIFLGNNAGGWDICERGYYELYQQGAKMVNPWQAASWFPTAPQGFLSIHYGIKGYSKSFVCDRASGASALYFAMKSIQNGSNDIVLAGGTEAPLTPFGVTCYFENGELASVTHPENAYRPFNKDRTGVVLGEGSTILILEEMNHAKERGAKIYGELLSGEMTTDLQSNQTASWEKCINKAIKNANIQPKDLSVIFAEGCGTSLGDQIEVEAITNSLGEDVLNIPISIPKSMYGHLYGASTSTEVAIGLLAMESSTIPPTININDSDFRNKVRVVSSAEEANVNTFMVNARSREGVNASFIIGKTN
ncbi:beta-ketoacyl synthase [Bacillus pseudomycoides]|nr:beta-ketoacyl synthase [Bacillus pseudomycoides]